MGFHASDLARLSQADREAFIASLTPEEAEALLYHWPFYARPNQMIPPPRAPDDPRGDWLYWLLLAGRGFGKELHPETPIPTPSGWATMGELQVGDAIFDEAGRPCRVLAKFAPPITEQYRVTFSDGSHIDAGADHQWVTWTHAERKAFLRSPYEDTSRFPANWPAWRLRRRMGGTDLPRETVERALEMVGEGESVRAAARQIGCDRHALTRHVAFGAFLERDPVIHDDAPGPQIRTTADILATLTYGPRGDRNHCIPCAGALDLPDAELPIPPYTLGVWLGDGMSKDGGVTAHQDDAPHTRAQIEADGFETTDRSDPQSFGTRGLYGLLRKSGLLQNKHVPAIYLRASAAQRLALLQGLMDTDGNIEAGSTCAFVNTNKRLVDAVEEIVHSLGMKTRVWSGVGRCNGEEKKQFWRVNFTPTVNPFSLPRKADRITLGGGQSLRNHHRMIVSVEPITPVQMYCITVDSPHSLFLAGRAMIPTHNSRTAAETTRSWIAQGFNFVNIIGATVDDLRSIMIEGESGIMAVCPRDERPRHNSSKRRLEWPNGAVSLLFSAEEPDRLRGKQHSKLVADELASWRYPETWDQALFGLRLGRQPQAVISTTPRPTKIIRDLVADPRTHITRGSTFDNRANLASAFIHKITRKYEGTRLGRQELDAEILLDVAGALWTREMFDREGFRLRKPPCDLLRVVVAVDPSGTKGKDDSGIDRDDGDEIGIVVAGLGVDLHGYVLYDGTLKDSPENWARQAIRLFHRFEADHIVAEVNFGGDLVRAVIQSVDNKVPFKTVHATRGKVVRAEPVSTLYEQGRVFHIGVFANLEDQLCGFTPAGYQLGGSPDRADALVWAITELMLETPPSMLDVL